MDFMLFLCGLVSVVVHVTGSTCPINVGEQVQECTSIVVPKLSVSDRVRVVKETCREAKLRQVADCIQGIVDLCKGTTENEQMVQRLIDKDRLLSTVEYFCRYFRVYETHAECMFNHHEEVSECSRDATASFGTKMSSGANIDVLMMGSCRFHGVARACLTNTTLLRCGREAADFVYELLSGMSPPYCEEVYPGYETTGRWYTGSSQGKGDKNNAAHPMMPVISLVVLSVFGLERLQRAWFC